MAGAGGCAYIVDPSEAAGRESRVPTLPFFRPWSDLARTDFKAYLVGTFYWYSEIRA